MSWKQESSPQSRTRISMRFLALTLILICLPFNASSQIIGNSISGIVTDPSGAVIPEAKVVATLQDKINPSNPFSIETKTDEEGNFVLKNLSAGKYKLSVTANGFSSETEKLVSIPQNKSIKIKLEHKLGLGCERISEGSGAVTEKDKAEIVRLAFTDAMSWSSGLLMKEQREKDIIVSTKNIKSEWLSGLSDIKFRLMSQKQIQQKADSEGDFLYVSFPELKARGQCVVIEVANTWAVGRNSGMGYVSGGGDRYEFRKVNGKWIKKNIGGWIS